MIYDTCPRRLPTHARPSSFEMFTLPKTHYHCEKLTPSSAESQDLSLF